MKEFKRIYNLPHTHFYLTLPKVYRYREPVQHNWVIQLTEKSKYELPRYRDDEMDWSKLVGLSLSPRWILSRYQSYMIGWRYNRRKDWFEACIYYHDQGHHKKWETSPILSGIRPQDILDINFTLAEASDLWITIENKNKEESLSMKFDDISSQQGKLYRTLPSWFGGNRTPKQLLSYKYIYNVRPY